jgi:hypothetical protein
VQRAVRHGRWKLIRYPEIDPPETGDLSTVENPRKGDVGIEFFQGK